MIYRVDLTLRAVRNLRRIYREINATASTLARAWFNDLEVAVLSLDGQPTYLSNHLRHRRARGRGHTGDAAWCVAVNRLAAPCMTLNWNLGMNASVASHCKSVHCDVKSFC
jgi:hypothetical protein